LGSTHFIIEILIPVVVIKKKDGEKLSNHLEGKVSTADAVATSGSNILQSNIEVLSHLGTFLEAHLIDANLSPC
jgi:hypothetical protein